MLANERLIFKMTTEQKIKLVTSTNLYENSANDNYEFPVFRLSRNPLEGCADVYATFFPSDGALASSWNMPLIAETYFKRGEETGAVKKYSYFNVSDDLKAENISEDYFLTAKALAGKAEGLLRSGRYVNFEESASSAYGSDGKRCQSQAAVNLKDTVLNAVKPRSVLVRSCEDMARYKKQAEAGCLLFGVAFGADETLKYLFGGCTLVFCNGNYTAELCSRLEELIPAYRSAYADYRAGAISLSELDRRRNALEVFDGEILDAACDRLISALLEMRGNSSSVLPDRKAIKGDHVALFDEVSDDALALTAARQSAVLLKNDGVLPLSDTVKVAVIGECAKEDYVSAYYGGKSTCTRMPFDAINNYDINALGFASGYSRGMKGRVDLIKTATGLCGECGVALVYLCAERGAKTLPDGQLELLEEISKTGIKIVAAVSADGVIDCSFADKCAAVIITFRSGQGETVAVLDIIKGIVSPSGRLTETFTYNIADGRDYTAVPRNEVRYPFGYGLSYTEFSYSNLKVNERGISFTVENKGGRDGFCVPQFYVSKPGTGGIFKNKILRGFSKIYLKKNDGARVEIPFDENTFRVFDAKSERYSVEGGEYIITVGDNAFDERLTGSITLSEYIFKDDHSEEVVEKIEKGDASHVRFGDEPQDVKKAKRDISFGVKLFVAILLCVYCEGVLATLAFTQVVSEKDIVFYAVIGALAAAVAVLFAVYVVFIAKKRKKQKYIPAGEVIRDLVDNVEEFDQIAKVTYKQPLAEEKEEDAEEFVLKERKNETVEEAADEDMPKKTAKNFVGMSFGELCENFRKFVLTYGVGVDITSVRALFAAFAASKIVLVRSSNAEVLPDFLAAVDKYFGGCGVTQVQDGVSTLTDIMRKREDDKFVLSDLVTSIYEAVNTPEGLFGTVVNNVKLSNLTDYFAPFISFANHPTEPCLLKINGELSLLLPENIVYILSLADGGTEVCPRQVADAALRVDLLLTRVEKTFKRTAPFTLTGFELDAMVTEARENYFLSEKVWRKFDDLYEAVGAGEKFFAGNKNVLQLEKFTSVLLECGADESECITDVFTAKTVPLLKLTSAYAQEGGDKTVFGIIEKLFGEEDLTKIQRSLSKNA